MAVPRCANEADLLAFLNHHGIAYARITHPAVFTCEEAARYRPVQPGLDTKNIFLRDAHQQYVLVVTDCARRLDLKRLSQTLGLKKLHFGAPEALWDVLGSTAGAVTMLGLVNDAVGQVRLFVDGDFWPSAAYLCHPMVNTATLTLSHEALLRFLEITGHTPEIFYLPKE